MGFQFNHVGGGTKTRRPITLHMKYNSACVQPNCFLLTEDAGEQEVTLEELQARPVAPPLITVPGTRTSSWWELAAAVSTGPLAAQSDIRRSQLASSTGHAAASPGSHREAVSLSCCPQVPVKASSFAARLHALHTKKGAALGQTRPKKEKRSCVLVSCSQHVLQELCSA